MLLNSGDRIHDDSEGWTYTVLYQISERVIDGCINVKFIDSFLDEHSMVFDCKEENYYSFRKSNIKSFFHRPRVDCIDTFNNLVQKLICEVSRFVNLRSNFVYFIRTRAYGDSSILTLYSNGRIIVQVLITASGDVLDSYHNGSYMGDMAVCLWEFFNAIKGSWDFAVLPCSGAGFFFSEVRVCNVRGVLFNQEIFWRYIHALIGLQVRISISIQDISGEGESYSYTVSLEDKISDCTMFMGKNDDIVSNMLDVLKEKRDVKGDWQVRDIFNIGMYNWSVVESRGEIIMFEGTNDDSRAIVVLNYMS